MTTYRILISRQCFAHAVIDVHAESPEQAEVIASERIKDREFFEAIEWDEADDQISIDAVYPVNDWRVAELSQPDYSKAHGHERGIDESGEVCG